jgi:predicted DNA-binding transcriptional regulator YafY
LTDNRIEGLDDIKPLYDDKDFYYFDIINDGDPYDSLDYIKVFKTVVRALKESRQLQIAFNDGKGNFQRKVCTPRRLEYSEKDDKFRLICLGRYNPSTINLARILNCELHEEFHKMDVKPLIRHKSSIILEILNERNALERCMLHFSNYEKVTTQLDEKHYEMKLMYYSDDETEVLIRVLSFGPMVKVKAPESFIVLVKERLMRQRELV